MTSYRGTLTEQRLYDALVPIAAAGLPCPSNEELAELLGVSISAPPGVLTRLEHKGLIQVERYQRSRVVTIVATGARTQQPASTAVHWRDRPAGVPAPSITTVRSHRPELIDHIAERAAASGTSIADLLCDLVWIGWQKLVNDESVSDRGSVVVPQRGAYRRFG